MVVKLAIKGMKETLEIPDGSLVLIEGPVGAGKKVFAREILKAVEKKKGSALIISTSAPPESSKEFFGGSKIIDCFSWLISEERGFPVFAPSDLNGIVRVLLEGDENVFVVDSLVPFFLHNESDRVIKFVEMLRAVVKKKAGLGIMTVESELVDSQTLKYLEYYSDFVFSLLCPIEERKIFKLKKSPYLIKEPVRYLYELEKDSVVFLEKI